MDSESVDFAMAICLLVEDYGAVVVVGDASGPDVWVRVENGGEVALVGPWTPEGEPAWVLGGEAAVFVTGPEVAAPWHAVPGDATEAYEHYEIRDAVRARIGYGMFGSDGQ